MATYQRVQYIPAALPLWTKRLLVALTAFSVGSVAAIITLAVINSPKNVSLIPVQFEGMVNVARDESMYADGNGAPEKVQRFPHLWRVQPNREQMVFGVGTPNQMRITVSDGDQMFERSNGSCVSLRISNTTRLHNYAAISQTRTGSMTINGVQCEVYSAIRSDGSQFHYSIAPTGSVCHINDNGIIITFGSFNTFPQFSRSVCPSKRSIFGWLKCEACEHVADWVIDVAVDAGCGLLTDGLAIEICNAAINIGCEWAGCDKRVCDAIHMC